VWAFQQAWTPFALSIHQEADAKSTYATVFLGYCVAGAAAVAALSLFSPVAIRIFATPAYDRASHVIGTMSMSYVLMGLGSVVTIGYTIAKASRPTAIAVAIAAMLTIALNALLVPRIGMIGSAVATLVGQGIQPVILLIRSRRVYHVAYPVGRGAAILGYSMLLVVLGETLLPPALSVSGFAIRVLALLTIPVVALSIGIVTPEQLQGLRRKLRAA
jgi:O-antigen/teichoic acid export membrane protein